MNSSENADPLRFVLVLDFPTQLDLQTCLARLDQLNQRQTGCLNSDSLKVQINEPENRFQIGVFSRNWKTIDCIGSLSEDDVSTRVLAKISLTPAYLGVLSVLTCLALFLLLPIPGSVSLAGRLLAIGGCGLMWYFILKQRLELRDLIQATLKV